MKSNSRVLRGWRDFGVKATAIILTILLATQMVGTPAFASGALTNKQASEDIATTVDDTGVEPSGTEATDTTVPDEAAGAANEPAPADSTQATEEPVVETVESATEPAAETPAADPAANAVLGTEPAPAPAVEQDQLASIKLNLADGASITLSKDGNKIDDDTNPIDVPANEELKFTAQAADGWQVDKVKTVIDSVEAELTADANGEYKVAADKVTDKLTVKVEAVEVAEDPVVDATEPEQSEEADEESVEGDAIEESAEESTPEMAVNEALQAVNNISLMSRSDGSGSYYSPYEISVGETMTSSEVGWTRGAYSNEYNVSYNGKESISVDRNGNVTGKKETSYSVSITHTWKNGRYDFERSETKYFNVSAPDPAVSETVEAYFYVIRPGADASDQKDESWMYVGTGIIDVSGLNLPAGQNPGAVSRDVNGRVVTYPDENTIKQRIANLYGLDLETTEISYTPYKISYPNGWTDEYGNAQDTNDPTYHVDMSVSYATKTKANANFYLWDAASDGYDFLEDEYQTITLVDGVGSVNNPGGYYPSSKTENGVTYVFSGWYDNPNLSGEQVKFPDEVTGAMNYYAKYVPQNAYSVRYYDEHNSTNGTVLPNHFNKDYPQNEVAYAATSEEVVNVGGEVAQGQQRLVGWSTELVQEGILNGGGKFEQLVAEGKYVAFGQQLPQEDIDLYAIWMMENYAEQVFHSITYFPGDGVDPDTVEGMPENQTQVAAHTQQQVSNAVPTRDGYDFAGWEPTSPEKLDVSDEGTFTMPESDVVFTATWKRHLN